MDKYEFNIKVEQMRKLVNKSDYETAMKIADTIDWKKVRNANLLSMVATIYEKNGEYQDAKDILLLAFERAPIGKRLLYKLTDLALKEGNTEEAEAYYREFCDLAGDDPRQYLLRYKILKAADAPLEQQIHALESYTSEELDEKWLYELAELYQRAGDEARCVSTCDRIMLMFGLGKYVDKAMELKVQYAPLNKYQMDLVENREKYEEKLRAVEQSSEGEDIAGYASDDGDSLEPAGEDGPEEAEEMPAQAMPEKQPETTEKEALPLAEDRQPAEEAQPVGTRQEAETEQAASGADEKLPVVSPDAIVAEVTQAETEKQLAREMSRLKDVPEPEADSELGKTRILSHIRRAPESASVPPSASQTLEDEELVVEDLAEEEPDTARHLMIEARTPQKGLDLAVQMLKQIHKESGVRNPVVKISGSRLNKRGILNSAEKLSGRDLIVEEAGDLTSDMLRELEQLMARDTTGMRIILIDNPKQMELLHAHYPALSKRFEWVVCEGQPETGEASMPQERQEPQPAAEHTASEAVSKPRQEETVMTEDNRPMRRIEPVTDGAMRAPDPKPEYAAEQREPAEDEEMDIDEFAQYCCKYASEIDCSITGKSMLALYERIEIMEEDGIPLTKASAEDLIEEAADKAEKPSFGKRLKRLISSPYDKDGLLILKEEHFI